MKSKCYIVSCILHILGLPTRAISSNASSEDTLYGEKRQLLTLSDEMEACLFATDTLHRKPELSQLFDLTIGDSRVWARPMEVPLCAPHNSEPGSPALCDVRHVFLKKVIDFDLMKNNCERLGGEFVEFDARIEKTSEDDNFLPQIQDIKHIPICLDRTVCTEDIEISPLLVWMFEDSAFALPKVLRSNGWCDEKADDLFFIKYTLEGELKTMTCGELSQMVLDDSFPVWMAKHPCNKKWAPEGNLAPAKFVCPVTCKQNICIEDPQREFLNANPVYPSLTSRKTCAWLSGQSNKDKKKICKRRFLREDNSYEFPPIPSAYSACTDTCSNYIDKQF